MNNKLCFELISLTLNRLVWFVSSLKQTVRPPLFFEKDESIKSSTPARRIMYVTRIVYLTWKALRIHISLLTKKRRNWTHICEKIYISPWHIPRTSTAPTVWLNYRTNWCEPVVRRLEFVPPTPQHEHGNRKSRRIIYRFEFLRLPNTNTGKLKQNHRSGT